MHLFEPFVERANAANPINFIDIPSRAIETSATFGVIDFANRIIEFLLSVAYPLAFAAIIYISYLLITSGGNPDAYGKVKKNITYLVTGLFLIVFAVIGIRFLAGFLVLT